MKLIEVLKPTAVVADLRGASAQEVLAELCQPIASATSVDAGRLQSALLEREALSSTGVGEGVAIPHCRLAGLPTLTASFGRARAGVDFKAIDAKPCHLFVALFAPATTPGVHLQALARVSRLFKSQAFRDALLKASGDADLFRLIATEDAQR